MPTQDFLETIALLIPPRFQPFQPCDCGRAVVWGVADGEAVHPIRDVDGTLIKSCELCREELYYEPVRRSEQMRQQAVWESSRARLQAEKEAKQSRREARYGGGTTTKNF